MRYDREHKEQVRRRIVAGASRRLRHDGIAAVGVRALIGEAGLTHGTFYSHFPTRADLVAQAIAGAFEETCGYFSRRMAEAPPADRLRTFVDGYLTMRHRDEPHRGCAGAALAPEVAREGEEARRAFLQGIGCLTALIADALPAGGSPDERTTRARSLFAGAMGAMQLARIADDDAAEDILAAARTAALRTAAQPWDTAG